MFDWVKNAVKAVAKATENWDWEKIGTGILFGTTILGLTSSYVSKKQQEKQMQQAAEKAVKKLMSPKE